MKGSRSVKARGLSAAVLAAVLLLAGCGDTSSQSSATASTSDDDGGASLETTSVGETSESTDTAASEEGTDDETSSPSTQQEDFSYPDEPEPAPEVTATLCNLDADYFKNLRPTNAAGEPVVDDSLRMSVLSLGDNLSLWSDLQRSFPEVEGDVARAQNIYDAWDKALLLSDNGDAQGADEAMATAEAEIEELPSRAPDVVEQGCSS